MDEKNTANDFQTEIKQCPINKEEEKSKFQTKNLKRINGPKEKDLANEVLYFSINQDSKLVIIIYNI